MSEKRRIIFCGSTTWTDEAPIRRAVTLLPPDSVVIHGGTKKGADAIVDRVARSLGMTPEVFEAEWDRLSLQAGPIRNSGILRQSRADALYAFNQGTPGTTDMVKKASRVLVFVFELRRGAAKPAVCRRNCGHSLREHRAFDDGLFAGAIGEEYDALPFETEPFRTAWITGHSVGASQRDGLFHGSETKISKRQLELFEGAS